MKEDKQLELDKRYLRMAFIWSENSYALRRKVGALIVKDNSIISDGYNGTPSGFPNVCEYAVIKKGKTHIGNCIDKTKDRNWIKNLPSEKWDLKTYPYVLHAEANAITKLAKSHNSSEGATLYVTDSPCMECAKLIIQAGIRRIVYAREYRLTESLDLLTRAGIEILKLPTPEGYEEI